jgi:hypothetical protein
MTPDVPRKRSRVRKASGCITDSLTADNDAYIRARLAWKLENLTIPRRRRWTGEIFDPFQL